MSKAGELLGRSPEKTGKSSLRDALGNLLRWVMWWRADNARLDYAEGDLSADGRFFAVTLRRFDGKALEVHLDVYQLDELSDLFVKAAIGLAHKVDGTKPRSVDFTSEITGSKGGQ